MPRYDHDYERDLVIYRAVDTIDPGTEITVNYSGDPDGTDRLVVRHLERPRLSSCC